MGASLNPKWQDFFDAGVGSMVFGKKGPNLAALAVINENQRKARIEQGKVGIDKEFAGFNDQFYNNRAQAYIDYALPQLGEQARDSQKQLTYGLNARGVENSSIARNATSELSRQVEGQKQAIAEQGILQGQELQRQVEESRAGLYNQLLQSSDPAGAGMAANAQAARYQQPSTFAPVLRAATSGLQNYSQAKEIGNEAMRYGQGGGAPGYTPYKVGGGSSGSGYNSQTVKP